MSFDWTKIAGYREGMTADEKLALLNTQEVENQPPAEPEPEIQVPTQPEPEQQPPVKPAPHMISKVQFDKVASELAKVKKELRARMSAEEQKEADRKANDEAMRLELEALRREKTLSNYKAS